MSLPLRLSVWSASSEPGTAGSGICFTQTTTFIRLLFGRGRPAILATVRAGRRNVPFWFAMEVTVAVRFLANRGPGATCAQARAVPVRSLSMEQADVVVVGAGPAGTAAAITAADLGMRVVCLDKATFPRDKTCGDGLTDNALRLLERLGVPYDALAPMAAHETVSVSPGGRQVVLPMGSDGVHGAVVPRRRLDAVLVSVARGRGV